MKLTLKIEGLDKLQAALGKVASEAARKSMVDAAAQVLRQMSEQNFRSEKNRPAPWPALAQSTVRGLSKKRKKGAAKRTGGARPLIDTGTLMRSLRIENVTGEGADLVSDRDYAGYHQFGSVKRANHPPARPFVPVTGEYGGDLTPTPSAEKRMLRAAEDALKAAAKAAGFKTS